MATGSPVNESGTCFSVPASRLRLYLVPGETRYGVVEAAPAAASASLPPPDYEITKSAGDFARKAELLPYVSKMYQ